MTYAIKTLQNQSELIKDLIEETQNKYDNAMIESMMDEEFFKTDLFNLKKQLKDLNNAILILYKQTLF